jgi:hypothetical protein
MQASVNRTPSCRLTTARSLGTRSRSRTSSDHSKESHQCSAMETRRHKDSATNHRKRPIKAPFQSKQTQSMRKRYHDRWCSRTPKPALRKGQISETRAAGCVAPRKLARGKPSHPLHRRITLRTQKAQSGCCVVWPRGAGEKEHECTAVRRRRRGQRLTVTVQSQCQGRLSSSRRTAAIAQIRRDVHRSARPAHNVFHSIPKHRPPEPLKA